MHTRAHPGHINPCPSPICSTHSTPKGPTPSLSVTDGWIPPCLAVLPLPRVASGAQHRLAAEQQTIQSTTGNPRSSTAVSCYGRPLLGRRSLGTLRYVGRVITSVELTFVVGCSGSRPNERRRTNWSQPVCWIREEFSVVAICIMPYIHRRYSSYRIVRWCKTQDVKSLLDAARSAVEMVAVLDDR